jgi:hypothetical protein
MYAKREPVWHYFQSYGYLDDRPVVIGQPERRLDEIGYIEVIE